LDALYSEKNELLIISYQYHIEIRDINSLNEIQIINKKYSFLFNINKDLFIAFNNKSISLYQRIIGTKYFQLLSKKDFLFFFDDNYRRLLKLDNKIIMASKDDILYLINIKTMKIIQEFYILDYPREIHFNYKIDNNIYICKNNILLEFKYIQGQIIFINKKEQNNLFSLNYVNNLYIEKKHPNLHNKIKINCIQNKIIDKNIYSKNFIDINHNFESNLYEIAKIIFYNLISSKIYKSNELLDQKSSYKNELFKKYIFNEYIIRKEKKIKKRTEKIIKRKKVIKKYKITYPPKYFKKNYR